MHNVCQIIAAKKHFRYVGLMLKYVHHKVWFRRSFMRHGNSGDYDFANSGYDKRVAFESCDDVVIPNKVALLTEEAVRSLAIIRCVGGDRSMYVGGQIKTATLTRKSVKITQLRSIAVITLASAIALRPAENWPKHITRFRCFRSMS